MQAKFISIFDNAEPFLTAARRNLLMAKYPVLLYLTSVCLLAEIVSYEQKLYGVALLKHGSKIFPHFLAEGPVVEVMKGSKIHLR